jgi:hypothetical protein
VPEGHKVRIFVMSPAELVVSNHLPQEPFTVEAHGRIPLEVNPKKIDLVALKEAMAKRHGPLASMPRSLPPREKPVHRLFINLEE